MRRLLLLGFVVPLLAGCLKVDMHIAVEDDGSGTFEGVVAINLDALNAFGGAFEDADGATSSEATACSDFQDESTTDVPDNVTVDPYEEDGFCGVEFNAEFEPSDDPAAQLEGFDSASGGAGFTLRKEGENWVFDMPLSDVVGAGPADTTAAGDSLDIPGLDYLFDDAEYKIELTLPGRPVDHNADEVDGNTFRWDVDLTDPPVSLFAQTEPGTPDGDDGEGFPWALVVGILAAAAVIGAIVLIVRRGGRTLTDPVPPVDPHAPPVVPPTLPPSPPAYPSGPPEGPPPTS